ncbi:MAG: metal-dependent hydrolase, partial [Halobaculum sp.]
MWPWEHAAVGYLWYSLGRRAAGRDPPGDWPAVALALATQFPDLLDKSLSWGLGLFETGYALGHSIFLAIPLGVTALLVGQWRGRPDIAVAVTVGYWSHL